jgi:hypothetical protein
MTRGGTQTSRASPIMQAPSTHSTSRNTGYSSDTLKLYASRITVSSRSTSHIPRVSRNPASWLRERPRRHQNQAPSPAVMMNTGAQKCVTHRVRNSSGVVRARSVGDATIAS